ncbi:exosortase T [Actibacterium sp. 188UL27-1]|uniref:exosortase T n=1 Tax=Actibacterium sp. 188UL27-1 TaxID=2786961 RepID=UPI001958A283|nr:exosortase T [Actibacterium sp. 188UL27-1]MBM7069216.1 exosortase T [Actibacterium sp. 188UL27-1]
MTHRPLPTLALASCALASIILAIEPVRWLINSWTSPTYDSNGYVYLIGIVGLVAWSVLSGPSRTKSGAPVLILLALAAGIRLLGQVLAINTLGALALIVDIYAIARLLGVADRPFALSPLWLAVLFLFTLPVEVIAQRLIGYPLQLISADLACSLLGVVYREVSCTGIRITVQAVDVLVDLPCSGATGLLLALAFAATMNAIYRPRLITGCALGGAIVGLAVAGNAFRITALAIGLEQGWDVMAEPAHSLIGLVTLALSLLPVALFYRPKPAPMRRELTLPHIPDAVRLGVGAVGVGAALLIVTAPAHPIDVSSRPHPLSLPAQIGGHLAEPVALTAFEQRYFEAYGGQAAKAQFGPLGINLVSTRSPLRHLHAPEVCLRGLGYTVEFRGTRLTGTPYSVYRATGLQGDVWHVSVTYVSDAGHATASIGEAIWLWLAHPGSTWRSVQRITPMAMADADRAAFELAAVAALDLPQTH